MTKLKNDLLRFLMIVLFLFCFVPSVFGATIDVMIVYDTTAKLWVGRNGGMTAFAVDAVARMNQAVVNSNVDLTFRLVCVAEVLYTHSDLYTDLINLKDAIKDGTGELSVVHQWRNTYGADIVAMLVDTGSDYGIVGYGYTLDRYSGVPDYACSTNAIRSVNISHTLTHEVGHNLGCGHSKFQTSNPGPNTITIDFIDYNTYSAGWYFTGTNANPYHTIMAYSDKDNDGDSDYSEAPLFSTPLKSYEGTVAGHALDGDNARTIRETMDIVAGYRQSTILEIEPWGSGRIAAPFSDYGSGNGIWSNDGTSWSKLTDWIPGDDVVGWGTNNLAAVFSNYGLENGIWSYNGSSWAKLTDWIPGDLEPWDTNKIAAEFHNYGTGNGIWSYNGSSWAKLTDWIPVSGGITAWGGTKIAAVFSSYGSGNGIWNYNGSSWTKLTDWLPEGSVDAWGANNLAAVFTNYDSGNGIWSYNDSTWNRLTNWVPGYKIAWGGTKYAAAFDGYGSGNGLWSYDGTSWTKLTDWVPQYGYIEAWGTNNLAAVFSSYDTGNGIWSYNGTSWAKLTDWLPVTMSSSGNYLTAVFNNYGSGNGVWKYDGIWTKLTDWIPSNP